MMMTFAFPKRKEVSDQENGGGNEGVCEHGIIRIGKEGGKKREREFQFLDFMVNELIWHSFNLPRRGS